MTLLTPALRQILRLNALLREMHLRRDLAEPDPCPVVKLFSPVGAATWIATELDRDDDTLFGLADLGFGCPELGAFSLSELASVRLPYGLRIERDLAFLSPHRLSVWTAEARRADRSSGQRRGLAAPSCPARPHPFRPIRADARGRRASDRPRKPAPHDFAGGARPILNKE